MSSAHVAYDVCECHDVVFRQCESLDFGEFLLGLDVWYNLAKSLRKKMELLEKKKKLADASTGKRDDRECCVRVRSFKKCKTNYQLQ